MKIIGHMINSVPPNDCKEHIHSIFCGCKPIVSVGEYGKIIVTHRPFDGRISFFPEFENYNLN